MRSAMRTPEHGTEPERDDEALGDVVGAFPDKVLETLLVKDSLKERLSVRFNE